MNVIWDNVGLKDIKSFDYKPFGELDGGDELTKHGFATAEYDGESSCFAMGMRMYSAEFGRFLSVDPLFEAMPRHTPYHYSFNSPLVWKDPSGLIPEKEKDSDRLMELQFPDVGLSEGNYIKGDAEIDFDGGLARAHDALLYAQYLEATSTTTGKYIPTDGRTGGDGSGDNGEKKMRIGYDYWTDGENYTREMWVEDDDGRFSYCESGSILDGQEFTDFREFKLDTREGVDPEEWLTGIQMGLDAYGMVDQTFGGALAGVLSATIDLYRGNYVDAGIGLLSAVPIIGIAGDLYKAKKIAKAVDIVVDNTKRFDKNQSALIELAKESKKIGGITNDEAQILRNWSIEYKINFRGPEIHPNRNFKDPHYHLGPVDHIKTK
ncbi:MAG: hypothetical protein IAE98_01340 [Candidatus Kapabacteria bacterium]|nr:hypothetical protein [Candidatus Kapabacteria bacterium]